MSTNTTEHIPEKEYSFLCYSHTHILPSMLVLIDPHMHRVHYRALQELGLARSPYSNALVRIGEMPAEDRERLVIEGELDSEYLSEHSDESDEDQYDISTEDYEFEYAYGDNEGPNDGADAANAAGTTDEKRGDHDSNDEYSFQYEDDIDAKDSDTNADAIIPTR